MVHDGAIGKPDGTILQSSKSTIRVPRSKTNDFLGFFTVPWD